MIPERRKKDSTCLNCKKNFRYYPADSAGKFCSRACIGSYRTGKPQKERKNLLCEVCYSPFQVRPSSKNRTCSRLCKNKLIALAHLKIVEKECPQCKKIFLSDRKFCNSRCYALSMVGIEKKDKKVWENVSYDKKIERLKKSFEKYVIKNDGCWDWKGSPSKKYGSLQFENKSISAHRASWLIHNGPIPDGMFVCHTCDKPRCNAPTHLFLGTAKDNVSDMIKKGRAKYLKGEKAPWSKLTENNVREIKNLLSKNISMQKIADIFNVKIVAIFDIKHNKTWKHIQ